MLIQEQLIQTLDITEIDLDNVEHKETDIVSDDGKEECEETEDLTDNEPEESKSTQTKQPISGKSRGEKTFDRFLDLMEIF